MTPSELLEAIQGTTAIREGASPHGMSADMRATQCGMAAAFAEKSKRQPSVFPIQFFDAKGKPRVIGSRAGSVFHALNEMWAKGVAPSALPAGKAFVAVDAAVAAALDSFQRYVTWHAGDLNHFGECLGTEVPFDGHIVGQYRTGRADRVIKASQEHVDLWSDLGVFNARPGMYLWDYKLVKAVTADAGLKYRDTLQPLAYMQLFEQRTGTRPEGFIFDIVSRAVTPKIARLLVLVSNLPENLRILEGAVKLAHERRLSGEAVAFNCDNQYSPCPFKKVCPRYGTATEHQTLIEQYAAQFSAVEDGEGEEE